MDVLQLSIVIAAGFGFWLARWNYIREGLIAQKKQAVYGVHFAQLLAGRNLEDWEISIISDSRFHSLEDYLVAKHDSILYGMPSLERPDKISP